MKKYLILLILLAWASTVQAGGIMMMAGDGGPYCTQTIVDLFNRADNTDLGASWTEFPLDINLAIVSTQLNAPASAVSEVGIVGHTTALGGATQYGRIDIVDTNTDARIEIMIRSEPTDGDPGYYLKCTPAGIEWNDASATIQTSAAITCADGMNIACLVKGTGIDTVMSVWANVTATVPWSGGTACTDTAKPCWDNAGDAPDVQFTNNPTAASDTDQGFGVFFFSGGAFTYIIDNVYGGYCSD